MSDVKGLYLAGEYLFLIAGTEGALATGKKAAEMVLKVLEVANWPNFLQKVRVRVVFTVKSTKESAKEKMPSINYAINKLLILFKQ